MKVEGKQVGRARGAGSRRSKNARLQARKGAVVAILGIIITSMVAVSALAIDFSRLWTLRNELQTAADAGAMAGAIQLIPPRNPATTAAEVHTYANLNKAMQDTVRIDSLQLGDWDDAARTFTPGAATIDAVHIVVSRQMTGLLMGVVGVSLPRLKARATSWASAPLITANGCFAPWAVPYVRLMERINSYRGFPNTPTNLTRPFDPDSDMVALQNMSATERSFTLKMGDSTINNQPPDSAAMPGNYNAMVLPKWWDSATQSHPYTLPQYGAFKDHTAYMKNLSGEHCYQISVGDSLMTKPGNMVGPTLAALDKSGYLAGQTGQPNPSPYGVCESIVDDRTLTTNGDCINSSGGAGVDLMAAFYVCETGCTDRTVVEAKLLGSFTLKKIYPNNDNQTPARWARAQVVGEFKVIQSTGIVGGGSTTLQRPILVR